jgi:hypothetical protein
MRPPASSAPRHQSNSRLWPVRRDWPRLRLNWRRAAGSLDSATSSSTSTDTYEPDGALSKRTHARREAGGVVGPPVGDGLIHSTASIRARCPGALASGASHVITVALSPSARATYMAS